MGLEMALVTWVHLIAAALWVGGGLFLGAVLAPVLKQTSMTAGERIALMVKVGRRFNLIAVPALIILILTGLYKSHHILGSPDLLYGTSYGGFLIIKMILVAAVIAAFAVHVWIIRGTVAARISSGAMPEPQIQALRKRIIILGEATSAISVTILLFAALMDAGI